MRAIEFRRSGQPTVLEYRHDRPPPLLSPETVVVRVHAAGVNPIDCKIRGSSLMRISLGISSPVVPGYDFSGTITELGSRVSGFHVGDAVVGMLKLGHPGSYAEYLVAPMSQLVRKPPNIDFEEGAALPLAGLAALQLLRRSFSLETGRRVLVNGASGGVGTFAVQIARAHGATVTGVTSARNTALVHTLGAIAVIDYTKEQPLPQGEYDGIVDTVGNLDPRQAYHALAEGGIHASCAPSAKLMAAVALSRLTSKRSILNIVKPVPADLAQLVDLAASGRIRPIIDRVFSLDQAPEAHRYLETGRARGKVVLAVSR